MVVVALIIAGFFAYRDYKESRNFRFIFFDVGQGDAALIRFSNQQKILIDCGPDKTILSKLSGYLGFFDRTIDYLVITHAHKDHYGGCIEVLKKYKINHIIENIDSDDLASHWQAWRDLTNQEGSEMILLTDEFIISDLDAELYFFPPPKNRYGKSWENNRSIITRLTYGTTTALFTGDIEKERILDLMLEYCSDYEIGEVCPAISSEYFKVPHHGSEGSLNKDFYSAVASKVSIFSVGKNSYGHPSLRVVRNLEHLGGIIWRTDQFGDLVVR